MRKLKGFTLVVQTKSKPKQPLLKFHSKQFDNQAEFDKFSNNLMNVVFNQVEYEIKVEYDGDEMFIKSPLKMKKLIKRK